MVPIELTYLPALSYVVLSGNQLVTEEESTLCPIGAQNYKFEDSENGYSSGLVLPHLGVRSSKDHQYGQKIQRSMRTIAEEDEAALRQETAENKGSAPGT